MRRIVLYVLEGAWNTDSDDGCKVIGVAEDRENLQDKLELIAGSQAGKYVMGHAWTGENEERGERYYEIRDDTGSWAKFYITEHYVDISEALMGAIGREMEKLNCIKDIREYLRGLYESGDIEPWKYEYMEGTDNVIKEILRLFQKMEDCNISYNVAMDTAVGVAARGITLDDGKLEYLWEKFGGVMIDDNECILEEFLGFAVGTFQEEIWHWFDEHYTKGVAGLMNGCALRCKQDGDRVPGTIFSEGALMVGNNRCAREAQCPAGYEGKNQKTRINSVSGMPEDDEISVRKTVPADVVRRVAYKIHEAGGCDAVDSYSKGHDDAITLALDIIMEETGLGISEILEYGECE